MVGAESQYAIAARQRGRLAAFPGSGGETTAAPGTGQTHGCGACTRPFDRRSRPVHRASGSFTRRSPATRRHPAVELNGRLARGQRAALASLRLPSPILGREPLVARRDPSPYDTLETAFGLLTSGPDPLSLDGRLIGRASCRERV